jgi:hypothetical protein
MVYLIMACNETRVGRVLWILLYSTSLERAQPMRLCKNNQSKQTFFFSLIKFGTANVIQKSNFASNYIQVNPEAAYLKAVCPGKPCHN